MSGIPTSLYASDSTYSLFKNCININCRGTRIGKVSWRAACSAGGSLDSTEATGKSTQQLPTLLGQQCWELLRHC